MPRSTKLKNTISSAPAPMEPFSLQSFVQSFTPKMFLKIVIFVGIVAIALFVLSLLFSLFNTPRLQSILPFPQMGGGYDSDGSYAVSEEAYMGKGGVSMGMPAVLSTRNVVANDMAIAPSMPYPYPSQTTGNTAEQFEVTDYNASIETTDIEGDCDAVAGLKGLTYVIFENANESTRHCHYTFKVEHAHVEEVLAKIEALNPKSLSESTYTIKRQLDDFTSEIEILEKKKKSIEETLETALNAYDDITALATKTQDAESLARVITSKVSLIERLTQERININQQLDYIARAKAEQLDRLAYTYFYVDISERKYIDGEALSDSWYQAVRQFVHSINYSIQTATLQLIQFIVSVLVYLIYLIILIVVAKFLWKFSLYMWKR